jgi:16S rRNA (uracil1498-N3)-methyltransferase
MVGRRSAAAGLMHIVVAVGTLIDGAAIALDAEESHHLTVRRLTDGTALRAIDGQGGLGLGHAVREGEDWLFQVEMTVIEPRPADTVLAVGAGDRERFLLVAEKAAELGVTRVIPIETRLSRSVENRVRDNTIDKARKRAREACKQSGNAWFPDIDDLTAIDDLGNAVPDARWFLADARGEALPAVGAQDTVAWLIGPEGGFTDDEVREVERDLAATRVALARHVLRYETAAIAAAVVTDTARATAARARRQ